MTRAADAPALISVGLMGTLIWMSMRAPEGGNRLIATARRGGDRKCNEDDRCSHR